MPCPHLLFIDGLPGSGKSTTAVEIGHRLLGGRIFLECQPGHPLLVALPDERGAAFANIHEVHSVESFAAEALTKFEAFLGTAEGDVQYVFESHPMQSTVRVLGQLDAPEARVLKFWSDLQDRLEFAKPRLVYFQESDPRRALIDIIRKRGPSWESYVVEAFNRYPWTRARNLSGVEAMLEAFVEYSALINRLTASWRYPLLTLTARPQSYQERTNTLIEWLENPVRWTSTRSH
jgi:DNA polymerase III delta prime subunit